MRNHLLLGCKGCGNAIVEAAFAVAGVPLDTEAVDYADESPSRPRLLSVNPLGQVPTLVLPGGGILTESLAMVHYLDDLAPHVGLVPKPGDPARADFLRWSTFVVAAIYPTYTYGDDPKKWVGEDNGKRLRESTDRHRERLWMQLDGQARTPWFLGERFSALDLYAAVMTRWRPGPLWFAKHAPNAWAAGQKAAALPPVAAVMHRHFE